MLLRGTGITSRYRYYFEVQVLLLGTGITSRYRYYFEVQVLLLGTGMLQRVKELKWLGIYFGAGKHIKIVMHENRRKYYECLAGIVQKAGHVNKECLVKSYYIVFFQN